MELVLFLYFSEWSDRSAFFLITLFTPLAGVFHWKKAGRVEQMSVKLSESSQVGWAMPTLQLLQLD